MPLVTCFRKAGIISESEARSQSDDYDPIKILAVRLEDFQDSYQSPLDFRVDVYVDAEEDVTSEAYLLTAYKIITRVTQTHLDATENDD